MDSEIEHLRRVNLEPGDVLVVHVPRHISDAQCKRIKASVEGAFVDCPPPRVIVLTGDMSLTVVHPAEALPCPAHQVEAHEGHA